MAPRMAAIASDRPMKTASPIRWWPMLSSTTCGMAATASDVVEGQAVAGVDLEPEPGAVRRGARAAAPSSWAMRASSP